MLTGFLLGIGAAFFWSVTNIIDKHLITRYSSHGSIGGILLLSCFFPVLLMATAVLIDGGVLLTSTYDKLILIISGVLMVGWIYFYLKALEKEDASVVMIMLVLAPIFSLLFSSLLLGEHLTTTQLIGGGIVLLGALSVSYEPGTRTLKWRLVFYALAACCITGLMYTLFKVVTVTDSFWDSVFWRSAGMVMLAILIYGINTRYRQSFHHFAHHYLFHGLSLNTLNETLSLLADTIFAFAILFAPVALVQTTESYQPIFIIVIVFVLTKLGVTTIEEKLHGPKLYTKLLGILLVLTGSFVLSTCG